MAVATALGIIGIASAAFGAYTTIEGTQRAKRAQDAITAASIRAEELRAQQMRLEAFRRQREAIRNGIVARSQAISNATAQGASSSSGLEGGLGQIVGQTGQAVVAQSQNLAIGEGLFSANAQRAVAEGQLGNARSDQQFGNALYSFGSSLVTNADTIDSVGKSLFSGSKTWEGKVTYP